VLRFTHGTLEWTRPITAFSATDRNIAMARNVEGWRESAIECWLSLICLASGMAAQMSD